jgi:carbamoyltransferase
MKIIGLYGCVGWEPEDAWLHSAGASLFIDNEHTSTISEERLSRIKYDGSFPNLSIDYVLEEGNITKDQIDIVSYAENVHSSSRQSVIKKVLQREFPNAEVVFVLHHMAHAAAAFFTSGFVESSILTFDGAGNSFPIYNDGQMIASEYETGFYGWANNEDGIQILDHFKNGFRNQVKFNLGQVYNNISRYIYNEMEPEKATEITNQHIFMESAPGKVMGLAAYGDHKKVDLRNPWEMDCDDFPCLVDKYIPTDKQMDRYEAADMAAWLQNNFENALINYFNELKHRKLLKKNLCLSGGCALNVLANEKILNKKLFDDIHVFPASNDSGLPFGAAVHAVSEYEIENSPVCAIKAPLNLASLGKTYTTNEIMEIVNV